MHVVPCIKQLCLQSQNQPSRDPPSLSYTPGPAHYNWTFPTTRKCVIPQRTCGVSRKSQNPLHCARQPESASTFSTAAQWQHYLKKSCTAAVASLGLAGRGYGGWGLLGHDGLAA